MDFISYNMLKLSAAGLVLVLVTSDSSTRFNGYYSYAAGASNRVGAAGYAGSQGAARPAPGYRSTLSPTYTPSQINWAGRAWRVNAGATWAPNMVRSLQISPSGRKVRFEIRNTNQDNSKNDGEWVRRSELSGSIYGDPTRLPNGVALWGAFSTKHHSWADPAGMAKRMGGVYGQIHFGAGGSPAMAFRRTRSGELRITTRGDNDRSGTVRYQAPLSFDRVHDIVYRIVLDPDAGQLTVWIDGARVVNVSRVSIGNYRARSYWNQGLYFAGGVSAPVVAEYANTIYPSRVSLAGRVARRPAWPTD